MKLLNIHLSFMLFLEIVYNKKKINVHNRSLNYFVINVITICRAVVRKSNAINRPLQGLIKYAEIVVMHKLFLTKT